MWMWRTDAGEVPSGVRHLEFSSGSERLLAITYAFYMYKYINSRLDVLSEKRKPAGNRPGVSGCSAGVLLILRWCGFLRYSQKFCCLSGLTRVQNFWEWF